VVRRMIASPGRPVLRRPDPTGTEGQLGTAGGGRPPRAFRGNCGACGKANSVRYTRAQPTRFRWAANPAERSRTVLLFVKAVEWQGPVFLAQCPVKLERAGLHPLFGMGGRAPTGDPPVLCLYKTRSGLVLCQPTLFSRNRGHSGVPSTCSCAGRWEEASASSPGRFHGAGRVLITVSQRVRLHPATVAAVPSLPSPPAPRNKVPSRLLRSPILAAP